MGQCYITRRGTKTGGAVEQLGIYPTGNDGRPMGNVTVLSNVTNLSKYPFIENSNVLTVALPENLRGLADYCFQKCTGLQDVTIPNKVTTIPQYCYDGCSSLSKITLPKGLTTISQYAFQNCKGLYNLVIPDDIGDLIIQGYAFSGCQGLDNDTVTKLATKINTPVYASAFANLTGITEVTTTYVFNYYFSGCTSLKKVTILNAFSDGSFGSNVFDGCSNLTTVILPDNAKIITSNMFNGTKKLTTINFPSSITQIGVNAFSNCTSLKNLDIPDNTSYTLGSSAFYNSGITEECAKNIVAHATSIGDNLFQSCSSLVNVEVPVFANYMFNNCTNLKSATSTGVTGTIKTTGNEVFYGCSALERAKIADGTTIIGSCIFDGCKALKTVYLPSSITTATNSSLTSTSSSYYAFYNCTALEDVQLGQDWNMSLRLNVSNNLTVDSMVAMFNSLKDLTGDTAKTLTLGSTNLTKLTDEQKAIATNKNWTLA